LDGRKLSCDPLCLGGADPAGPLDAIAFFILFICSRIASRDERLPL